MFWTVSIVSKRPIRSPTSGSGDSLGKRASACGSIFFRGHKIVTDNLKGIFDKDAARALLTEEAAISAETGNPCIVDVIGDTGEALARHAEFVLTETGSPILFDSLTPRARVEALELLQPDADTAARIIYNSLDPNSTADELETIAKYGIKSAVLLAFDKLALLPHARMKLLTEPDGLLDKARMHPALPGRPRGSGRTQPGLDCDHHSLCQGAIGAARRLCAIEFRLPLEKNACEGLPDL